MAKATLRREPVRLDFRDGEVIVTPKDRDIFFISADRAAEACRETMRQDERVARFTAEFLVPLKNWCESHKEQISACFAVMPESAVLPVYVVGAAEAYDFELTRAMSDLSAWFNDQGWSVETSQIPRCEGEELFAFFNPDHALQVYG